MRDITYSQFKILKSLHESGKRGFNDKDLTQDHWELVRNGFVNNLVSLGMYSWVFEITQQGIDYITKQEERDEKDNFNTNSSL